MNTREEKGENGQPALDAKSQIRRELLYSINFQFKFQPRFLLLVFFLLVILLWILWINTHFISVVSYPFPAESTFNEWFQNIAWKLRTLWKEGGMTWVRLIFNKEILTQQYIFFCCKFKAIISEKLTGENRNDQSVLRLKIWRMGRKNEEKPH